MIPVTKSFLPDQELYQSFVQRAFDNGWLTNRGELVLELEEKLKDHLATEQLLITNNGTSPLQIALKLLAKNAEVITTPFSYVATTSSVVWEGAKPVFVDVEKDTWTIDPKKIVSAITPNTKAILATHVFGNPCDIDSIQEIADKHDLKVIYDAAHCFDVKYKGESIFNFGDVSTCSFHATKLFHSGEGGAIFAKEPELFHKIYYSHNFGHKGPLEFHGLGINAKISELQAAMGLAVLPSINEIISERKKIVEQYKQLLQLDRLQLMKLREHAEWNYSYFPVVFESEEKLLKVEETLNKSEIFPRRYFYPTLNRLPYLEYQSMPIAESISERILCLPLYVGLTSDEVSLICELINNHL